MRVLFQGAGAIAIAGAAMFGRRHEAVVVSRTVSPGDSALPLQLAALGRGSRAATHGAASTRRLPGTDRCRIPGTDKRRVLGTDKRRVPIIDWPTAATETWDLIVVSTRPGDLDAKVREAIERLRPPLIALTSQVDGDVERAVAMFPGSEIVVFSPAFLSERTVGRTVRFWRPPAMPAFLVAGRRETVCRLRRELGSLVIGVPTAAVFDVPAVFIPYAAELSARHGDWAALKSHLRRPTAAASEAVRAVTGLRLPMSPLAARLVLEAIERISPLDMNEYAGRHFGRHEAQTLDMLDGWIGRAISRSDSRAGRRTNIDPQTNRQTNPQSNPQANRQSNRQANRQANPQASALVALARALRG